MELKNGMQSMDKQIVDSQKDAELKAGIHAFEKFKEKVNCKIDDLENRCEQNNLVFWNIPEGKEEHRGCIKLLEDIILNHVKLRDCEDIVIERAHHSSQKREGAAPRPIHCKFLHWGDKEHIIKRVSKALKGNPYGEKHASIIVTDDVSKSLRQERKILKDRYLEEIYRKPAVQTAFIPYVLPARIQYKEENSWKFFYLHRN